MIKIKKVDTVVVLRYITAVLALVQGVFYFNQQLGAAISLLLGGFFILPPVFKRTLKTFKWVYPMGLNFLSHLLVMAGLLKVISL